MRLKAEDAFGVYEMQSVMAEPCKQSSATSPYISVKLRFTSAFNPTAPNKNTLPF